MRHLLLALLFSASSTIAFADSSAKSVGDHDGQLRGHGAHTQAWNASAQQWQHPVEFWRAYAATRGGITWGQRQDYPPYAQVKELDTLLIELPSGLCLMEFFHSRWRRANDVRRWDDDFNRYGSCARVFD